MKITFKKKENAFDIPPIPALARLTIITTVSLQADGKRGSNSVSRMLQKCSH